jgi:predicted transcriptional regulator of viral defense system
MPNDNDQSNHIDPLTIGELITIAEASQISGLDHAFLSHLAKKGRLKTKRLGRFYVTTVAAIEEYKTSRHRGKKIS